MHMKSHVGNELACDIVWTICDDVWKKELVMRENHKWKTPYALCKNKLITHKNHMWKQNNVRHKHVKCLQTHESCEYSHVKFMFGHSEVSLNEFILRHQTVQIFILLLHKIWVSDGQKANASQIPKGQEFKDVCIWTEQVYGS